MVALIIIGIILSLIFFIWLGYYLWATARERYDHNIFGVGVIIRGVASLFCLTFAVMLNTGDGSLMIWIIAACILWIWTFFATWTKSSFFIALFSLVYQLFAVFFVIKAVDRLKRGLS
tara:strand:- start:1149 stop:1502 length:354 start_codon:yes stop_codon:yes gene_type:complete